MSNDQKPTIRMITSYGPIVVELYPGKAPLSVENFLTYVEDGFYDNTLFHRIVDNFMIQGGGFEPGMIQKATRPPIRNESRHALLNARGTLAMARLPEDPHSGAAQFFINTRNNDVLDFTNETPDGWGYCAFGRVTEGMNVVDRIEGIVSATDGDHHDVPVQDVIIETLTLLS